MKQPAARIRPNSVRLKSGVAAASALLGSGSSYTAGDITTETMHSFHPPHRSADGEILGSRDKMVSRQRDLVRNNGWAAGAVGKEVDSVIGSNFRPLLKPDWRALGLSAEWAADWKEEVAPKWESYANDPLRFADVTRSQTVPLMFGTAYRSYLIDGEAIGVAGWRKARRTKTTLRVTDPDLLSNPDGRPDSDQLRGGVELTTYGAARAYYFRQAHPDAGYHDGKTFQWKRIEREKSWGRPVVIHFFDKLRDGQTRGVSRLAPIVEKLRMEDHYSRVELQAAVINAVLAAFIRSPMGPEAMDDLFGDEGDGTAVLAYNQDRSKYYENTGGIRLGGSRISMLYSNDEIGVVPTARPAAQFGEFESAVLRNVASGLGISYEQLASDWSKTNYSSARAAMIEIWRGWTARRVAFAQGFCQPYFMAWLEEMVDSGRIRLPSGSPDFRENWSAYSRAKWIGPGKGFVDPVKEAKASAMRVSLGLSTLEEEAAELTGSDFIDNIEQIQREIMTMPEGTLHPAQESYAKLMGHNGGPRIDD